MRIFSAVQPTGGIHIGNYLGALQQFVKLQEGNDSIYCIADLHAITLPKDPKELQENILDVAALFIAVGINPEDSIIFVQSDVPGHSELAWILTCNAYTGELSRMIQFKDKSRGKESAPVGLFSYPLLMAADILLYDTDMVPVGNDQKQHIELTRDIAERMNNKFGEKTFVVPGEKFLTEGARIMSLDDPTKKMSKSSESRFSTISLLDDENKIKKSIMKSTTDSDGLIKFDLENKAGISNLLNIYSAFSGEKIKDIEKKYEGVGYGAFKKDLVEITVDALRPIKQRFDQVRPSGELIEILKKGSEKAHEISDRTIKRVKKNVGLGTP